MPPQFRKDYDDKTPPLIGEPVGERHGQYPKFELRLDRYFPRKTPKGLVDPRTLWKTSGEAIAKTKFMLRLYGELAGQKATAKSAADFYSRSADLLDDLMAAKGDAVFLECIWEDRRLICRRTDPRDKGPFCATAGLQG